MAIEMIHHLGGGFAHAHDVVDADFLRAVEPETGIGAGGQFFRIAQHRVHFRHAGIGLWFGLSGAAGDDDAPGRIFLLQPAYRLARLAHRFRRHRAGVDHHGVAQLRLARALLDGFAFAEV